MNEISEFIKMMERTSSGGGGGTDWRFWSDFGNKLERRYKFDDIVDAELIKVLKEYETIRSKSNSKLSSGFTNFANTIVECFEVPFERLKLKRSALAYIDEIVTHLLDALKINHRLITVYYMPPSLKILSDYVDEKGKKLIDDLFESDAYPESLLALHLVNCQWAGNLTAEYNERVKQLLSSSNEPLVMQSLQYYRYDKGVPDSSTIESIASCLDSTNADLQWNALAFFDWHIDYVRAYIPKNMLLKFLESEDEGVREKATSIAAKLSGENT